MLYQSLLTVVTNITEWCEERSIPYQVIYDESDFCGLMLFQTDPRIVKKLFANIRPDLLRIKLEAKRTRGGYALALASAALSETHWQKLFKRIVEWPQTFREKLLTAFQAIQAPTLERKVVNLTPELLQTTAKQLIANEQRQEPHRLIKRPLHEFRSKLTEALDGLATSSNHQPGELFQRFSKALSVLGQQMGGPPLQQQLKQRGINWRPSEDGQSLILYIINAQTKAPQPIARISSETLEKPNEFEQQLLNMIDFVKGDAPGAFKQRQQELQAQEKAVREIAKATAPPDPNAVEQQMQDSTPLGRAQQPTPKPQVPAPEAAGAQAALPKINQPQRQPQLRV